MIAASPKNIHLDYYLTLESDLERISRYIEFHEFNFGTFSIELAHQLLSSSSEVDVVMKQLCHFLSPDSKANNINDYKKIVKAHAPEIISMPVVSEKFRLKLTPWENWHSDSNPDWWGSYNNVKHERGKYFNEANLKNLLNSIAELLVINIFLNHHLICSGNPDWPYSLADTIREFTPHNTLFKLDDPLLYLS